MNYTSVNFHYDVLMCSGSAKLKELVSMQCKTQKKDKIIMPSQYSQGLHWLHFKQYSLNLNHLNSSLIKMIAGFSDWRPDLLIHKWVLQN